MARDPYKVWPPLELPAGSPVGACAATSPILPPVYWRPRPHARARATHYNDVDMLLAGDLGGTKTLLGLFRQTGTARPEMVVTHEFATLDFPSASRHPRRVPAEGRRRRGRHRRRLLRRPGPGDRPARAADQRRLGGRCARAAGQAEAQARPPAQRPRGDGPRGPGAARRRAAGAAEGHAPPARQRRAAGRRHRPRSSAAHQRERRLAAVPVGRRPRRLCAPHASRDRAGSRS